MSNVNIAVNAKTLNKIFADLESKINSVPPLTASGNLGPFGASFSIGFQVSSAANPISLTSSGVKIDNLEITYDPLKLDLTVTIPEIDIGGECICVPILGCACLPKIEIFPQTTVTVPIDLSGIFAASFSGEFTVTAAKQVLAAKGSLTPHQANLTTDTSDEILHNFENIISSAIPLLPSSLVKDIANVFVPSVKSNLADKWIFHLKDVFSNLQLIDIGDTTINILDKITDALLSFLPSAIRTIAKAILQPVIDAIGAALDIGNDILNFLENLFQSSLGIGNMLETFLGNIIFQMWPLFLFADPFPMIQDNSGLIAVLVPVENVAVAINAPQEIVISANIL
ncbi:MAG TPA: hypothetical protein VGN20_27665 [Mucilaginibacter sp.]|jgi:hypothetical protein